MPKYSITINFFVPKNIVEVVKKIEIPEKFVYDWRKEGFFHCTVKAIELRDTLPSEQEIELIINKISKIIVNQRNFEVVIKGVGKFPNVFYAKIDSPELIKLHKKLCTIGLPSINKKFEDENYIPHASLVALSKPYDEAININKIFGKFIVKEIQLVVWDTSEGQHNPKVFHRFNLK
ncbi:2'-5' RNA ligase family protein [Candidatus Pacearchaeota archaeon]|nr:2'-5' RNA ligase family protein [Candidatus Pacearchaeota archaeon]